MWHLFSLVLLKSTFIFCFILMCFFCRTASSDASFVAQKNQTDSPILADFDTIVAHQSDQLLVYRYRDNPSIYIFDYPSLAHQGMALNRVGALIETAGTPRDRVLSYDELDEFLSERKVSHDTFFYGHNYRGQHLSQFFNFIHRDHDFLNEAEEELRQILLDINFLEFSNSVYSVPNNPVAFIAFSQIQADNPKTEDYDAIDLAARCAIFRHELSHGEFFTNMKYKEFTFAFWERVMRPADRLLFRNYLIQQHYNPDDLEVMVNETQAYLVHTQDPRLFNAQALGMKQNNLSQLRQQFLIDAPETSVFSWTHQGAYLKHPTFAEPVPSLICDPVFDN